MAKGKTHHKDSPELLQYFQSSLASENWNGKNPFSNPKYILKHKTYFDTSIHIAWKYHVCKEKKKSNVLSYKEMPLTSSLVLLQDWAQPMKN